jgi:hypothetical protein
MALRRTYCPGLNIGPKSEVLLVPPDRRGIGDHPLDLLPAYWPRKYRTYSAAGNRFRAASRSPRCSQWSNLPRSLLASESSKHRYHVRSSSSAICAAAVASGPRCLVEFQAFVTALLIIHAIKRSPTIQSPRNRHLDRHAGSRTRPDPKAAQSVMRLLDVTSSAGICFLNALCAAARVF